MDYNLFYFTQGGGICKWALSLSDVANVEVLTATFCNTYIDLFKPRGLYWISSVPYVNESRLCIYSVVCTFVFVHAAGPRRHPNTS